MLKKLISPFVVNCNVRSQKSIIMDNQLCWKFKKSDTLVKHRLGRKSKISLFIRVYSPVLVLETDIVC